MAKGYAGKLTEEAATEGIGCVLARATELLEDARMLFERERYATSVALAITAVEEAEKAFLLLQIAVTDDLGERAKHWAAFRHHDGKLQYTVMFLQGSRNSAAEGWETTAELATLFQRLKEDALYVDTVDGREWRTGSVTETDIRARDFAHKLLGFATARVSVLEGVGWTIAQPEGWTICRRVLDLARKSGATSITASFRPDSGWALTSEGSD